MHAKYSIAVLPGDGIGPEIMTEAMKVLHLIESRNSIHFNLTEAPFGAHAWFTHGSSFPEKTRKLINHVDAVIKGPIGLDLPATQQIPVEQQPERAALLPLRLQLNTYANMRPIYLPGSLAHFSPLKDTIIGNGIDIILVRELVGGLYFGDKQEGVTRDGVRFVKETLEYDELQIKRILTQAFHVAEKRKKILHNIHKSNVLRSSVLWNDVLHEMRSDYPQIAVHNILVDAAATALCLNPRQFDVMVMENMFGDILSDQGGGIIGSLGLMPSMCLGDYGRAYYEPAHGSAPDIAGKGIANPYSMIGSVAMMLEYSFDMKEESDNIWQAMQQTLEEGYCTADLVPDNDNTTKIVSTTQFGDKVVERLRNI